MVVVAPGPPPFDIESPDELRELVRASARRLDDSARST
jgi:hypothetical protein